MLLKKTLSFITASMVLTGLSLAQIPSSITSDQGLSVNVQAFKQQIQQLRSQITQATASGDQQQVQQLQSQLDALILTRMQEIHAKRVQWLSTHPGAQAPLDQQTVWARFAQIKAKKEAWLQAHPAEAARKAQDDQFRKSQLQLFYALAAAVKNGNTQLATQLKAQLVSARQQYMQTGQIPQNTQTPTGSPSPVDNNN